MLTHFKTYQQQYTLGGLLLLLVPYILISQYVHPVADDFGYAYQGQTKDTLWNLLIREYNHWNGRYISNILMLRGPMYYDSINSYRLIPILLVLLTILCFYFLIKVCSKSMLSQLQNLNYALLITLIYLYQMPILSEGVYWYTGAVTYQLGSILSLGYLVILILYMQKRYILNKPIVHTITCALFLFVSMGFNEVTMLILFSFSIVFFIISMTHELHFFKTASLLLVVAILCCLLMLLAPGNDVRGANFENTHEFGYSFKMATLQVARFFVNWFSLPLILVSVLYYDINKHLTRKSTIFTRSFYLSPLSSILLLLFTIFIGSFPAYWATGIMGQHRTMNTSYMLFLIMWFINLTVIYNSSMLQFPTLKPVFKFVLILATGVGLCSTKNGLEVINDILTNKAEQFDIQMQNRFTTLETINTDTIYLNPITNKPPSIFVLDIDKDPKHFINVSYNAYFRNNAVILPSAN